MCVKTYCNSEFRERVNISVYLAFLQIPNNMSWQDYITTQLLGKNLKEGAIAGIDGQIWAKVSPFLSSTTIRKFSFSLKVKRGLTRLHHVDFYLQSSGLNVTMEEIKVLVDNYDSQHNLASTGFHLGGQKYFYLRYLKNIPTLGTSKVLFVQVLQHP